MVVREKFTFPRLSWLGPDTEGGARGGARKGAEGAEALQRRCGASENTDAILLNDERVAPGVLDESLGDARPETGLETEGYIGAGQKEPAGIVLDAVVRAVFDCDRRLKGAEIGAVHC